MTTLPRWADLILVPLISLLLAGVISALVILAIGQSPGEALKVMVDGEERMSVAVEINEAMLQRQS